MITKEDLEIARNLLLDFIKEMNAWEKFCNEVETRNDLTYDQQFALQKEKAVEIFSRYCTVKERKQGRPNTISYGMEDSYDYDINEEEITDTKNEDPGRIEIYTKRTHPMKEEMIYVLLKKTGTWLIDSKKRYSFTEKKWKDVSL